MTTGSGFATWQWLQEMALPRVSDYRKWLCRVARTIQEVALSRGSDYRKWICHVAMTTGSGFAAWQWLYRKWLCHVAVTTGSGFAAWQWLQEVALPRGNDHRKWLCHVASLELDLPRDVITGREYSFCAGTAKCGFSRKGIFHMALHILEVVGCWKAFEKLLLLMRAYMYIYSTVCYNCHIIILCLILDNYWCSPVITVCYASKINSIRFDWRLYLLFYDCWGTVPHRG